MTSPLDGVIVDGRHHMQIRVYYEDTDFSGIVYHANYLRFMERGRTNHLRLMGAEQHALFAEAQAETPGFAFVVRSMQIDFLKPARMDDVLDVVTWPVAVKGASITLAQEVRRGEDVLVKAEVRVAFISEGRAQPIPKALRVLDEGRSGQIFRRRVRRVRNASRKPPRYACRAARRYGPSFSHCHTEIQSDPAGSAGQRSAGKHRRRSNRRPCRRQLEASGR